MLGKFKGHDANNKASRQQRRTEKKSLHSSETQPEKEKKMAVVTSDKNATVSLRSTTSQTEHSESVNAGGTCK
jgi:hypothetical protein